MSAFWAGQPSNKSLNLENYSRNKNAGRLNKIPKWHLQAAIWLAYDLQADLWLPENTIQLSIWRQNLVIAGSYFRKCKKNEDTRFNKRNLL